MRHSSIAVTLAEGSLPSTKDISPNTSPAIILPISLSFKDDTATLKVPSRTMYKASKGLPSVMRVGAGQDLGAVAVGEHPIDVAIAQFA